MQGDPGDPAPLLVADEDLDDEILKSAGTVRHLDFRSLAPGQTAVKLTGGLGEDLAAVADQNAFKLVGNADDVTLLRDSVAQSVSGPGVRMTDGGIVESVVGLLAPGPGDVALRNVTALSSAGDAIRCDLVLGRGTLVNVIARGPKDVNANGGSGCSAAYSNLRPDPRERRPRRGHPVRRAALHLRRRAAAGRFPDGRRRHTGRPDVGRRSRRPRAHRARHRRLRVLPAGSPADPHPGHVHHDLGARSPRPLLTPEPAVATAEARLRRGRLPRHRPRPGAGPGRPLQDARPDRSSSRSARWSTPPPGASRSSPRSIAPAAPSRGASGAGASRSAQGARSRGMTTLKLRGGNFASCKRKGGRLASASPASASAPSARCGRATRAAASAPTATTASPPRAAPCG